ncbi:hypothetical protein [Moorena sp. SIO2C4]|uniref:hypothetical protein n=1 Tax=Moorena sp. SIO2C4 TaxID=2607824 RepID=UPI002580D47E|nr:hypothetical protein [Moorena sp. SIO2C4]
MGNAHQYPIIIGNRESGIGNRESGIGNRESGMPSLSVTCRSIAFFWGVNLLISSAKIRKKIKYIIEIVIGI